MKFFVPITKVDVEKREVWGRAVEEVADKSGEIFDYASSRPLFDAWSEAFAKATDGKSLGNLRAMHGKVAAGKLIAYQPDDAAKAIDIGTKVVDDAEWAKVLEGVYTGFSIGGSYEKRWKDPNDPTLTRYTASPSEVSIVDNPCVPTATFSLVKSDGSVEERAFKSHEIEAGTTAADDNPAPAASGETVVKVLDLGEPLRKGLWSVARLASLLQDVQWLASDEAWDAQYEGDGSPVPAQLREWLAHGVTILGAMTAEEGAEAVASVPDAPAAETVELAAPAGDVAKAATGDDELAKRIDALIAGRLDVAIAKATGELAAQLDAEKTVSATLAKRVTDLEALPAPAKGVVRAVTKGQEMAPGAEPDPVDQNDPVALTKRALEQPMRLPPGMALRPA